MHEDPGSSKKNGEASESEIASEIASLIVSLVIESASDRIARVLSDQENTEAEGERRAEANASDADRLKPDASLERRHSHGEKEEDQSQNAEPSFGSCTVYFVDCLGREVKGSFEGEALDGVPEGRGCAHYDDGSVYSGDWQRGLWHGEGHWRRAKGAGGVGDAFVYEGTFEGGRPWGKGVYYSAEAAEGEGDGVRVKTTKATLRLGERVIGTYTGQVNIKKGCPHGFGEMTYTDGRLYVGEWSNGKASGIGIERYGEGLRSTTFWGQWRDGKREGFGILLSPTGSLLAGQWTADSPNGLAVVLTMDRGSRGAVRVLAEEVDNNEEENIPESTSASNGKTSPSKRRNGPTRGVFVPLPLRSLLSPLTGEAEMVRKVYCGRLVKGEKEGEGVLLILLPHRFAAFEGVLTRGKLGPIGCLLSPDGSSYEGELKVGNGEKEGLGRFLSPNGTTVFEGEFKKDRPNGRVAFLSLPTDELEAEDDGVSRQPSDSAARIRVCLAHWAEGRREGSRDANPHLPYSPPTVSGGRRAAANGGGANEWQSTTEDGSSQFAPSLSLSPPSSFASSPVPTTPGTNEKYSGTTCVSAHHSIAPFSEMLRKVASKIGNARSRALKARETANEAVEYLARVLGVATELAKPVEEQSSSASESQSTGTPQKVSTERNGDHSLWKKEIEQWLRGLDLPEVETYIDLFISEEINLSTAVELTEEELKEIGIAAFGPRKKIAKAIIALRERREQVEEERAKQMMELKEREKEVAMKKAAARKRKEDRQRRTYRPFVNGTMSIFDEAQSLKSLCRRVDIPHLAKLLLFAEARRAVRKEYPVPFTAEDLLSLPISPHPPLPSSSLFFPIAFSYALPISLSSTERPDLTIAVRGSPSGEEEETLTTIWEESNPFSAVHGGES